MANKQPDRWESSILAAAMAVAGSLFLFDKLGTLVRTGLFSFGTVLHSAPQLLVVLGVSLMLAGPDAAPANGARPSKEGHYE